MSTLLTEKLYSQKCKLINEPLEFSQVHGCIPMELSEGDDSTNCGLKVDVNSLTPFR